MITVADAMTAYVHTCHPNETLERAAEIMRDHACSEVPVVDENGFLTAIVSGRSALLCAYSQGKALSEIPVTAAAVARLRAVRPNDSLDSAHELMRKSGSRCLPVVEKTGRLIGILSITDVIRITRLQGEPRQSSGDVI